MFKLVAAGLLLLTSSALAQEAPKEFTLTLTEPELGYIAEVLRTRPYGEVAALLNKIQNQVNSQLAEPVETLEAPTE